MANITDFNASGGSNILGLDYKQSYLYDASSFYNWEQDNKPLERLFSRTDLEHQFLGYPGDENRPTTMTLSSTANHALGVYDNWDDIVRRIPQRLTFPLLVEICDYGNLGDLELDGITTIGDGVLHINNKLHYFENSGTVTTVANHAQSPAGSVASPTVVTSPYARPYFVGASSTRLGLNIFDNTQFQASAGRMFMSKRPDTEEETDRLSFFINFEIPGSIQGTPYVSGNDNTIRTYDLDAKEKSGSGVSVETARNVIATSDVVVANIYGNYCQKVRLRNCYGNIKLEGICVDSASGDDGSLNLAHNNDHGFEIVGSNITLQNCAVARTRISGFLVKNSEINVLGSLLATRIYPRANNQTRTAGAYGIGLNAQNSIIVYADYALGASGDTNFNKFQNSFSRCDYGIKLESSKILGGVRQSTGKANAGGTDRTTSILQAFQNTKVGILAESSEIEFLGRLDIFNNKDGLTARNSVIKVPQFSIDDNQQNGLNLENSNFYYGFRSDEVLASIPNGDASDANLNKTAYHVSHNGINIYATKNSSIQPHYTGTSSLPDYIGKWGGHNGGVYGEAVTNHGSNTGVLFDLPSIRVTDGSYVELLNAAFLASAVAPVKGKVALVTNNSKLALRGTKNSYTVASMLPDNSGDFTLPGLVDSWQTAAICADNNSKVEITGPTKFGRFGIPLLAENYSLIDIKTPTSDGDYIPEKFKYGLTDPDNQTKVELHATRACVVVNRNSGLLMKNVGGTVSGVATTTLPRKNTGAFQDADLSGIWDNTNNAAHIQFYPNPFTSAIMTNGFFEADAASNYSRSARLIASGSASSICAGGMVVRAVNNSFVDSNMVNFLYSVAASSCSGIIYSYTGSGIEAYGLQEPGVYVSNPANVGYANAGAVNGGTDPFTNEPIFDTGGSPGKYVVTDPALAQRSWMVSGMGRYPDPCDDYFTPSAMGTQIQIWNFADSSRFHVANTRINFGDPKGICESSGFHGPTGKWVNGVALDYFGMSGAATTYNNDNAFRNQGVFRIMLGHRGDLKSYYAVSAAHGTHGNVTIGKDTGGYPIDQINAQGYLMFVGDASTLAGSDLRRIAGLEGGMNVSSFGLSACEDIWGWGLPAPGAGVPAYIHPEMAGYLAANYVTSGLSTISAVPNFPIPPIHMDWQGYMRNFVDETGLHLFSNAKQLSLKKVNGLSVYRSRVDGGGEGRDGDLNTSTFGVGVKSLNIFNLEELV